MTEPERCDCCGRPSPVLHDRLDQSYCPDCCPDPACQRERRAAERAAPRR